MSRRNGPEIPVTTDAAYPKNTLLMVNADGTYTQADATPGNAARIAGVQIKETFEAGQTTMRILSDYVTHEFIAAADVTDLTVRLTAAANGQVTPGGGGAGIAMPLHTAVAGEWVEGRVYRV